VLAPTAAKIAPGRLWIGGAWRDPANDRRREVVNPATEEVLTTVAEAGASDVDAAVKAARDAMAPGSPWSTMTPGARARILWRVADEIARRGKELAEVETLNNGKPITESEKIDLPLVGEIWRYYAGWPTKVAGEVLPVSGPFHAYTVSEPVGVCALIVPWNFPLLIASWKLAPALAAGCAVVMKPAEETPLTALLLAEVLAEAGVPPGVFNVVTGEGATVGDALVRHPGVAKVSFTGSTAVGQTVMRTAADTLARLTLELGGKSPTVVFADADLDAAVRGVAAGAFFNKGEVCVAGTRVYVESSVHDDLVHRLAQRAGKAKPGDTLDPKTRHGPQVSRKQRDAILRYIEGAKKEGADVAAGGKADALEGKGFWIQPTVMTGAHDAMTITREEVFGPVVTVMPFDSLDEVVARANATPYGLAAGIFTNDLKRAHRTARALRAGSVWINTYNVFDPAAPFGGMKMSGFGRDLGRDALEAFLETKTVWIDLS
jgi:acyl-CoA reductase-like NAD-dependent aldehyde dehydrogenase